MTVVPGPGLPLGSIPHLRIPFRIGVDGYAETVQQGSKDEIVQCVAMLVGTRPGTRMMIPSYGTPDPTFGQLDQQKLFLNGQRWEPRATINVVVTPGNEELITVQVGGGAP